jgi:hypothetical protein
MRTILLCRPSHQRHGNAPIRVVNDTCEMPIYDQPAFQGKNMPGPSSGQQRSSTKKRFYQRLVQQFY